MQEFISQADSLPHQTRRLYCIAVIALFSAALGIRLYLMTRIHAVTSDGASYYLPLAEAIAKSDSLPPYHVKVPLLYSQAVGRLARIIRDVELSARLVSVAGSFVACLFLFLHAKALFGPYPAMLALALFAFHPYQCRQAVETNLDSLAVGCFTPMAFFITRYLMQPRAWRAIIAGAFIGLMGLSRAEGIIYCALAVLYMFVLPLAVRGWRTASRQLVHVMLVVVAAAVICFPRLHQVQQATGWWVLDSRQITQPRLIWHTLVSERQVSVSEAAAGEHNETGRGLLKAAESLIGAFGPLALLFGVFAVSARSHRLTQPESLLMLLIVAALTVPIVACGPHRRYFLLPGALWQVWAGLGLVMMLRKAILRSTEWHGAKLDLTASAVLVARCVGVVHLPYALLKADPREDAVERSVAHFILKHYGKSQRIFAMRRPVIWYARGHALPKPTEALTKTWDGSMLATYVLRQGGRLIVAGNSFEKSFPVVWQEILRKDLSWGRIVHVAKNESDMLLLIELTELHSATF